MRRILLLAVVLSLALAGCSGGKKKVVEQAIIPEEITQQDLDRLQLLTDTFPTRYSFPGQQALDPLLDLWFNGTLAPGTGSGGIEMPNDDGPTDYGADVVAFDLKEHVPIGQPVELRIFLKWSGDPGASADLDIWANVPGTYGAVEPRRYDESINWNIVNKQRVLNSAPVEGAPFEIGVQVNNGKITHPDGMDYALRVELHFAEGVLAPGAPYAIMVPENATGLIMETESVFGDEHVDSEFLLIGPDDQIVTHVKHNDIGTETLFLPVPGPGEYVVYAHAMHGGFVRFESEVPNKQPDARLLEVAVEERSLYEGPAPAPGTYAEQNVNGQRLGSNSFGAEGTFDLGPAFPLDVRPVITTQSPTDAAVNITGPDGWLATAYLAGSYQDDRGRVGSLPQERYDRSRLDVGTFSYGVVANSPGVTIGIEILTFVR